MSAPASGVHLPTMEKKPRTERARAVSGGFEHRGGSSSHHSGFTLVELLVVIGIIVILIGILLPVISRVRTSATISSTQAWIAELSGAIERYQQDFRAYPGPLANDEIRAPSTLTYPVATTFTGGGTISVPAGVTGFDTTSQTMAVLYQKSTMGENLVLGLLGGLRVQNNAGSFQLVYDPSAVGSGPTSLNTLGVPKRSSPYLDPKQLGWGTGAAGKTGHYSDGAGDADDSIIPEFVDTFPDPMPFLYMRAKVGAATAGTTSLNNPVVTYDASNSTGTSPFRPGAYDVSQIIGYTGAYTGTWPSLTLDPVSPRTGRSIGTGKDFSGYTIAPGKLLPHGLNTADPSKTLNTIKPYDAYPYLISPSGGVRQKDGYILIGAGADRVYGTQDDQCSFGNVGG